jgi:hypothetical protein
VPPEKNWRASANCLCQRFDVLEQVSLILHAKRIQLYSLLGYGGESRVKNGAFITMSAAPGLASLTARTWAQCYPNVLAAGAEPSYVKCVFDNYTEYAADKIQDSAEVFDNFPAIRGYGKEAAINPHATFLIAYEGLLHLPFR